ncbi:hypothetical protein Hanom_Chr01g00094991 [Helianthus anomalus]
MFRVLKIMNNHPAITRICGMMIKNPKQYKFSSMRIIKTMKTTQFAFQMMKILNNQHARIKICGMMMKNRKQYQFIKTMKKKQFAFQMMKIMNQRPAVTSLRDHLWTRVFIKWIVLVIKMDPTRRFLVLVVDLFTPSPEYQNRKKRAVSVVCLEIIDLTESPICV